MALEITSDTPRSPLTIAGILLDCPSPVTEGHVCEANEAAALNQTYRENIRNNNAAKVKEVLEKAGITDLENQTVPEDVVASCQALIDEACLTYQFGVRTGGSRTPRDEALAMALAMVKKKILEKAKATENKKVGDWDKDELDRECERVLDNNPQVLEHCKQIVAQKRATQIEL